MADKHRIPANLTPSGDIIVPLSIPHDEQWTGLLLGVLILLEDPDYYQKDPNFDNEDAKVVAARWRDTTINPLIEAIAAGASILNRKFTAIPFSLGASQNTNSSTPVTVPNSTVQHTFSYENAHIRCATIGLVNSGAGGTSEAGISLEGETPIHEALASVSGTASREGIADSIFENVPVGVELDIKLMFSASSGTATMNGAIGLAYLIEEWG